MTDLNKLKELAQAASELITSTDTGAYFRALDEFRVKANPAAVLSLIATIEQLRDDLDAERNTHAELQSRCYEGYPTFGSVFSEAEQLQARVKEQAKSIAGHERIEKALRAELAETERVKQSNWKLANDFAGEITESQKRIAELKARIADMQRGEPVAWMYSWKYSNGKVGNENAVTLFQFKAMPGVDDDGFEIYNVRPLFTHAATSDTRPVAEYDDSGVRFTPVAQGAQEPVGEIMDNCNGANFVVWNENVKNYPEGTKLYAAPVRPAMTDEKLRAIFNALDRAIGDTDPFIGDDWTDEEIRGEYPVFWAAREISALLNSAIESASQVRLSDAEILKLAQKYSVANERGIYAYCTDWLNKNLSQTLAFARAIESRLAAAGAKDSEDAQDARDAERYRWLRDSKVTPREIDALMQWVNDEANPPYRTLKDRNNLDAAIDAAISAQKGA